MAAPNCSPYLQQAAEGLPLRFVGDPGGLLALSPRAVLRFGRWGRANRVPAVHVGQHPASRGVR